MKKKKLSGAGRVDAGENAMQGGVGRVEILRVKTEPAPLAVPTYRN